MAKECGGCRHWKEDLPEHLCLDGMCRLNTPWLKRTRYYCCEAYEPIDNGLEGDNGKPENR